MSEDVFWTNDGTPRSARFDDVYRSASGGLEQARHVFLAGCGLPAAWAGQAQWRILETGFGLGLNFLAAWQAWRDDPARPGILHFVSVEAWPVSAEDLRRSAAAWPALHPLAEMLAARWWGLLPGVHRFAFEEGRVLLTLCVGEAAPMLREQRFTADSVFLDGFSPARNPVMWSPEVLRGVARLCQRGAGLATWTVAGAVRRELAACGFMLERAEGLPPKRHCLRGRYAPAWEPKPPRARTGSPAAPLAPGRCVVIGGGLAGAAAAASLARRGWQVEVLDAQPEPAAGASALPAGLMAPHQSPDDNLLSRLTRAGVRITLDECERLLVPGQDWQRSGALEHRLDDPRPAPDRGEAGHPWAGTADAACKAAAGLPPHGQAWWRDAAAWIKPAALVRAWLAQPGITWRGGLQVQALAADGSGLGWRVMDARGRLCARADLVVVAAALGSAALLDGALPDGRIALNAVRGQIVQGWVEPDSGLPPWPVNGHGHLLPAVPLAGGLAWLCGSTYGRGDTDPAPREADRAANLQRLRELSPQAAAGVQAQFERGAVTDWSGVRCTARDRRPAVGLLAPRLAVLTALGSRGLSFAALCAELLAARLHDEPAPLAARLAEALDAARLCGGQLN